LIRHRSRPLRTEQSAAASAASNAACSNVHIRSSAP
jgi:hypothetical protein